MSFLSTAKNFLITRCCFTRCSLLHNKREAAGTVGLLASPCLLAISSLFKPGSISIPCTLFSGAIFTLGGLAIAPKKERPHFHLRMKQLTFMLSLILAQMERNPPSSLSQENQEEWRFIITNLYLAVIGAACATVFVDTVMRPADGAVSIDGESDGEEEMGSENSPLLNTQQVEAHTVNPRLWKIDPKLSLAIYTPIILGAFTFLIIDYKYGPDTNLEKYALLVISFPFGVATEYVVNKFIEQKESIVLPDGVGPIFSKAQIMRASHTAFHALLPLSIAFSFNTISKEGSLTLFNVMHFILGFTGGLCYQKTRSHYIKGKGLKDEEVPKALSLPLVALNSILAHVWSLYGMWVSPAKEDRLIILCMSETFLLNICLTRLIQMRFTPIDTALKREVVFFNEHFPLAGWLYLFLTQENSLIPTKNEVDEEPSLKDLLIEAIAAGCLTATAATQLLTRYKQATIPAPVIVIFYLSLLNIIHTRE